MKDVSFLGEKREIIKRSFLFQKNKSKQIEPPLQLAVYKSEAFSEASDSVNVYVKH